GDGAAAERTWKLLQDKMGPGGLRLGGRTLTPEQVERDIRKTAVVPPTPQSDWPVFRGNPSRSGWVRGSLLDLKAPRWQRPTLPDEGAERGKDAQTRLTTALQRQAQGVNRPVLPGFFPIAVGGKLIYRTYAGITAVNLNDVKDGQGKVVARAGEIEWKCNDLDGSLAVVMDDGNMAPPWSTG